jgi:hypothetical protein
MHRFVLAVGLALFSVPAALAGPRDELLRVAPNDAAIIVLVQNGRDHYRALTQSPFASWFPTTAIGKRLLNSSELTHVRDTAAMIFRELDTTRDTLIDDVVGDAVAFAFSPAPADRSRDERAVLLVRPRKTETLLKLLDKLNALQTKSGELKGVNRKEHAGAPYFERQKAAGPSEFYCFRGDLFAFSSSEPDIQAVIDRDKAAPSIADKPPELVARLQRLKVADAAGVILINPRPLDTEVKARVASAKPDEKRFLTRFAEAWSALDAAAVYLLLDSEIEVGVSVRFQSGKLPDDLKRWLIGPASGSRPAALIPKNALVGAAGHLRASELIDLVASLAPVEAGKPGVKEWLNLALGPVVGRDKLPLVLNALGPDWAAWAEPPVQGGFLPTLVAAVEISGTGEDRARAEKSLTQGIEFGFQMLRVAYNASHTDQIELKEEKDPKSGAIVRSLVNDKGFPPGFRPSFALVKGYLVLATAPEAIQRFTPPVFDNPIMPPHQTLARLSGPAAREYLQTHGEKLAKFLVEMHVAADERKTREIFGTLAAALELIDSAELLARPDENGLQLAVKVKPARPFKK